MLHTTTIKPGTFSLLKTLLKINELSNFSLVGGTALALQYGHRISVDIDLFSDKKFDRLSLIKVLEKKFGPAFNYEGGESRFGIFCFINGVKTDIVYYPHKQIDTYHKNKEVRMYSAVDIAAMKIQAILGRGKKKDFFDLVELINRFSLPEIMEFHKKKYPSQQLLISIPQAIIYFDDAEESEDPVSLNHLTWENVKDFLRRTVNDYLK